MWSRFVCLTLVVATSVNARSNHDVNAETLYVTGPYWNATITSLPETDNCRVHIQVRLSEPLTLHSLLLRCDGDCPRRRSLLVRVSVDEGFNGTMSLMPTMWRSKQLMNDSVTAAMHTGRSFSMCGRPSNRYCVLSDDSCVENETESDDDVTYDYDDGDDDDNDDGCCRRQDDLADNRTMISWYYLHLPQLTNVSVVQLELEPETEVTSSNGTVPSCADMSISVRRVGAVRFNWEESSDPLVDLFPMHEKEDKKTANSKSSSAASNDTQLCRSFLFPTDISVRRDNFLRIRIDVNCTMPDLNSDGKCSSPLLVLTVSSTTATNDTEICVEFTQMERRQHLTKYTASLPLAAIFPPNITSATSGHVTMVAVNMAACQAAEMHVMVERYGKRSDFAGESVRHDRGDRKKRGNNGHRRSPHPSRPPSTTNQLQITSLASQTTTSTPGDITTTTSSPRFITQFSTSNFLSTIVTNQPTSLPHDSTGYTWWTATKYGTMTSKMTSEEKTTIAVRAMPSKMTSHQRTSAAGRQTSIVTSEIRTTKAAGRMMSMLTSERRKTSEVSPVTSKVTSDGTTSEISQQAKSVSESSSSFTSAATTAVSDPSSTGMTEFGNNSVRYSLQFTIQQNFAQGLDDPASGVYRSYNGTISRLLDVAMRKVVGSRLQSWHRALQFRAGSIVASTGFTVLDVISNYTADRLRNSISDTLTNSSLLVDPNSVIISRESDRIGLPSTTPVSASPAPTDSRLEELVGVGCGMAGLLVIILVVLVVAARRRCNCRKHHSRDAVQSPTAVGEPIMDNWSIPRPQPRVWQAGSAMMSSGRSRKRHHQAAADDVVEDELELNRRANGHAPQPLRRVGNGEPASTDVDHPGLNVRPAAAQTGDKSTSSRDGLEPKPTPRLRRYAPEPQHSGGRHLSNGGDTSAGPWAWPWSGYNGPPSPTSEFPGAGGLHRFRFGPDALDQNQPGARSRDPFNVVGAAQTRSVELPVPAARRLGQENELDVEAMGHRQFDEESFSEVLTYYGSTSNIQKGGVLSRLQQSVSKASSYLRPPKADVVHRTPPRYLRP